jgi:hypothetical protein
MTPDALNESFMTSRPEPTGPDQPT